MRKNVVIAKDMCESTSSHRGASSPSGGSQPGLRNVYTRSAKTQAASRVICSNHVEFRTEEKIYEVGLYQEDNCLV